MLFLPSSSLLLTEPPPFVTTPQVFPDVPEEVASGLSSGAFLTCSADNTVRVWRMDDWTQNHSPNILSQVSLTSKIRILYSCVSSTAEELLSVSLISIKDLLNIIYIDGNTSALLDSECVTSANSEVKSGDGQTAEIRTGIRTICVSPDGKHLASGDRNGMLR